MGIRHTSRSLERHVLATRSRTWDVMLREIESAVGPYLVEGEPAPHGVGAELNLLFDPSKPPLLETVLSFEPPWRRVYSVEGDTGLDMYEGTFAIRDDGDECHLVWGVVVDPEPSDQGLEFLDLATNLIGGFLDHVVTIAQAPRPPSDT